MIVQLLLVISGSLANARCWIESILLFDGGFVSARKKWDFSFVCSSARLSKVHG